ncbi:MAG TPA: PRC-barrel domain-containing protein [Methylovirgula sp.]|nr:PRC-barrel domain-containing protein [Methylovirgula sp.]
MRRLIFSAALLAAVSTAALAANQSSLTTDHWLASDVYKASVYDPSNQKIGDIDDLIMNKDGAVSTAVIGVGGFLGVGQKDVAIPFTDLKVASNDKGTYFVLNKTKDDLKNAPAFDKSTQSTNGANP